MRRCLFMIIALVVLTARVGAQTVLSYDKPSKKEFKRAAATVLYRTNCLDIDQKNRLDALSVIQREMNNFSPDDWKAYNTSDLISEKEGVPYFYKKASDKVLKEIKRTKVKNGQVALWNLYNMGYIVKTPSHMFAIDLTHKDIDLFAQHLDFALISHKHRDHGMLRDFKAFTKAGVKVYAGHMPSEKPETLSWNIVEDGETLNLEGITVTCRKVDHNEKKKGLKLVTSFEINCGKDTGNTIILHSGDGYNHTQLTAQHKVDFFIFHSSVGLNIQKALEKIQPIYAVFSHAWELAHKVDLYRWTIDDLLQISGKITNFPAERRLLPCWGEKIVYTKKNLL